MTELTLTVAAVDEIAKTRAAVLAEKLGFSLAEADDRQLQLLVSTDRLQLQAPDLGNPIAIDFESGRNDHRRKFGGGRGQPLAKAIGLKKSASPAVIDATAGFARDAFVLASLGCEMTLLERNPILSVLIEDALNRATANPEISSITERMQIINCNAIEFLQQLPPEQRPDVIYMDPMYPSRDKKALVKKEMQLLHRLIGPDTDSAELLAVARKTALKRVVVKRPKGASYVGDNKPSVSIESKNTRYDVYVCT